MVRIRLVTRIALLSVVTAAMVADDARGQTADARKQLVATKAALYDSNFRNDQPGLRRAVDRALEAATQPTVRPMALYYAAWGEWTLSHSQMQSGELAGARASLARCEQHARAALALRPNDPEFVVMLANALIWRIIAEPGRLTDIGAEVRTLRTRALELAPENPRVIMMDAGLIFNNPPERGGSREKGLARWQQAIDGFEREAMAPSAADDLRPDWGRALAYAWVCDLYLAVRPRQVAAARAAARKALQLRPDFWYVNNVIMPRLK
jgi:hypothetical protein